jgi:hypothetical protein
VGSFFCENYRNWATFPAVKVVYSFSQEMDWATLWTTFSQTHLVTLIRGRPYMKVADPFFADSICFARSNQLMRNVLQIRVARFSWYNIPNFPQHFSKRQQHTPNCRKIPTYTKWRLNIPHYH